MLRRESAEAIVFWQRRWRDFGLTMLSANDFPFASLIADIGNCSWSVRSRDLPSGVTRRLQDGNEPVEILILSAVIGALHHATQQSSVSIWVDVPARAFPDHSREIGPFSNQHAITVEFARCRSLGDIVSQAKKAMALTVKRSEVPLDAVWRATGKCYLPRDVQVSFHHLSFEECATASEPLIRAAMPLFDSGRQVGLQIRSWDDGHTTSVGARYSTGCFDRVAVDGLLADIETLLLALADLTDAERSGKMSSAPGGTTTAEPYLLGSSPDKCYLCTQRDSRERHPT